LWISHEFLYCATELVSGRDIIGDLGVVNCQERTSAISLLKEVSPLRKRAPSENPPNAPADDAQERNVFPTPGVTGDYGRSDPTPDVLLARSGKNRLNQARK
jgi:hypothetical protein